ncbi:hypothetical protein C8Q74DRAFT_1367107 [Fomes fomentarius]|nr:hypothetical protein C8Q74DRAFT_1367107 [Fomes fomentarius]
MASSYSTYSPHQPASDAHYAALYAAANHPYPPHNTYDDSSASVESESSEGHDKGGGNKEGGFGTLNERGRVAVDVRAVTRTPSPTPSETKELAKSGVFDWGAMMKWRYWIRKEWAWYYVAFVVCLVGVVLFTVYHKTIVHWLRPAADWMHE